MSDTIYVKLLGEGTDVFRPVPAEKVADSVYLIDPSARYNVADEEWEFPPGSRVRVEERKLSGGRQRVAVALEHGPR